MSYPDFILQLPYLNHTARSNVALRVSPVINEETPLTTSYFLLGITLQCD
jgi:hypothetical protein